MMTKAERLREARARAGYETAADAARAFGWKEAAYRHHENGTRGFGADAAAKYGRAFRVKGGWLLGMDGVDASPPDQVKVPDKLYVHGEVGAGVWREATEELGLWELDIPPPFPGLERFGVIVSGFSMDRYYAPGTVLDCLSIFSGGIPPRDGDHVIVERIKPDGLRELTVKEFRQTDAGYSLRPCSTKPEFQDDILIGEPDKGHVGDDEVRVIGFVVSAINTHGMRLLLRMKKARKLGWFASDTEFSDT